MDALDIAVRSSAILALALVTHRCLHRSRAAARHALLAGALFTAAAAAPLGSVLPAWTVPMPAAASGPVDASPSLPSARGLTAPEGPESAVAETAKRTDLSAWAGRLMIATWLIGAAGCLARLLLAHRRLRVLTRRGRRLDDARWVSAARAAARAMGVRRPVTLIETDAADVLATCGVARPRVLVPAHARHWPARRVRAVLSHEMAHVARGDWLVQSIADLVLVAYWWHPLARLVARRLRTESERACDDAVLRHGMPARAYATHLVEIARACRLPSPSPLPGLSVAGQTDLHARIAAMLNSPAPVRALSSRAVVLIVLAILSIAVPLSALRLAPQGPQTLAGIVYDPTGAVVPGAKLTLSDDGQAPWRAVSDEGGRFDFGTVPPGRYDLEVVVPGFSLLKKSLDLRRLADWQPVVTLQIGEVRETITVRSARLRGAPAAAAPARVRVGGKISPPRKLRHVAPEYPESMRAAGAEGTVALEAIIGSDGGVQSARIVSGLVHPDLARAAIDAVRQWRFEPTLLNGAPVEVVMNVAMTFELEN